MFNWLGSPDLKTGLTLNIFKQSGYVDSLRLRLNKPLNLEDRSESDIASLINFKGMLFLSPFFMFLNIFSISSLHVGIRKINLALKGTKFVYASFHVCNVDWINAGVELK